MCPVSVESFVLTVALAFVWSRGVCDSRVRSNAAYCAMLTEGIALASHARQPGGSGTRAGRSR